MTDDENGVDPDLDGTISWSDLLAEATARLERAGLELPAIDARRIVEEATGSEPSEFHAILDTSATVRGVAAFDRMVGRRETGEPLQYVLGRWAFRHLDLMVDSRVLIPRPETEVVAGLAIDEVVARSGAGRDVVVADLGTGSGAIAYAVVTECTGCRVLATDRSPDALAVARANLAGLGRAASRVSLHEGSWFDALPDSVRGAIDVLISNPPYIGDHEELPAVVGEWEPRGALRAGPVGDEDLRTIIAGADEWVAPRGAVVLEMAPDQTAPIANHFRAAGWQASVHADLAGRDRAVVARKRS
ncbi:MAG: peptide chain release factor N(5)-glutamine methyltransferase [Actinomycetota bacterium]